jgi:hypothetical protein
VLSGLNEDLGAASRDLTEAATDVTGTTSTTDDIVPNLARPSNGLRCGRQARSGCQASASQAATVADGHLERIPPTGR